MEARDLFIQKEKLIEIIKRNPHRYSVAQLEAFVKLSNPTIRRTIEANDLIKLVQWERPERKHPKGSKKMNGVGFVTDQMLKQMFIFS